ncbi:MAG: radical SAM protein [Deltaproteobacteria bacterium]|jgi:hypothetical protein|nr:radical SAM protein [Deltaproteobacteria bacterium]
MKPRVIYFIITKQCLLKCKHCHFNSSPDLEDFFPLVLIKKYLRKLKRVKSIEKIIFTGGEPFLIFPKLRNAVHDAHMLGFDVAVWTSGYFIGTKMDFSQAVRYLVDIGLNEIIISVDSLHNNTRLEPLIDDLEVESEHLGVKLTISRKHESEASRPPDFAYGGTHDPSGVILYRGRAATELNEKQQLWAPENFDICPHQDLVNPDYLWLDSKGNLLICPQIPLVNLRQVKISSFFANFDPAKHKILAPIVEGGPFELAKNNNFKLKDGYVDHCHLCSEITEKIIKKIRK